MYFSVNIFLIFGVAIAGVIVSIIFVVLVYIAIQKRRRRLYFSDGSCPSSKHLIFILNIFYFNFFLLFFRWYFHHGYPHREEIAFTMLTWIIYYWLNMSIYKYKMFITFNNIIIQFLKDYPYVILIYIYPNKELILDWIGFKISNIIAAFSFEVFNIVVLYCRVC